MQRHVQHSIYCTVIVLLQSIPNHEFGSGDGLQCSNLWHLPQHFFPDSLSIILSHDWAVWIRSAFSSQRSQLSEPKLQVTARPEDLESNAGSRRSTQSKASRASRASRASKGSNASRRVLAVNAGCDWVVFYRKFFLDLFCWCCSTALW